MKTAMIGAAAAVLLMSTSAAAQDVDADAVCLVATGMLLTSLDKIDPLPVDMQQTYKNTDAALHYYTGVIHTRYSQPELGPVVKAGFRSFLALSKDVRRDRTDACIKGVAPALLAISEALKS